MPSNFEEVFTITKDVAQSVGKKGTQYFEVSKKRIELMDAKSKLSKAFEQFGRLKYDELNGEEISDDDYDCAIADIRAYLITVDDIEAQIEEAKAASESENDDLKRGAEELKNGVVSVSKGVVSQAKEVVTKAVSKVTGDDEAEADIAEAQAE